jgi:hypothetical protein
MTGCGSTTGQPANTSIDASVDATPPDAAVSDDADTGAFDVTIFYADPSRLPDTGIGAAPDGAAYDSSSVGVLDSSSVGADDSSSVGADDSSSVGADDSSSVGADAFASPNIQTLCNAFLAANDLPDGGGVLNVAVSTTCSGTELALFARDMGNVPADAGDAGSVTDTCLGCAIAVGCLDDNVGDTNQECDDFARFATYGTLAQCIAELQCALGVTGQCSATDTPDHCSTRTTTVHQPNGVQVNNLFCGSVASAACVSQTPASSLPGTCVGSWLQGIPPADTFGPGGAALGDGTGTKTATGVGNSVVQCLILNCTDQCGYE